MPEYTTKGHIYVLFKVSGCGLDIEEAHLDCSVKSLYDHFLYMKEKLIEKSVFASGHIVINMEDVSFIKFFKKAKNITEAQPFNKDTI